MTTAAFELSEEQQRLFDEVVSGDAPAITIGGYAGTGKTTLIVEVAAELGYVVCAYTGKAANVLRMKGCAAQTIHSTIYLPQDNMQEIEAAEKHLDRLVRSNAEASVIRNAEERLIEAR
jgi:cytidylate kinase